MSGYDVDAHAYDEPRYEDVVERIRAYGRAPDCDGSSRCGATVHVHGCYSSSREAYELDDPKHPDHSETLVDIWDSRESK